MVKPFTIDVTNYGTEKASAPAHPDLKENRKTRVQ
jgi:hypothetical protein